MYEAYVTDHVTLNFNDMSTAAVFLDIAKAFGTTGHLGLASVIKLTGSFLSQRKFRFSVEDEMSTGYIIQAGVPQGSILSPTLYSIYI
jgi:hypothetical protein